MHKYVHTCADTYYIMYVCIYMCMYIHIYVRWTLHTHIQVGRGGAYVAPYTPAPVTIDLGIVSAQDSVTITAKATTKLTVSVYVHTCTRIYMHIFAPLCVCVCVCVCWGGCQRGQVFRTFPPQTFDQNCQNILNKPEYILKLFILNHRALFLHILMVYMNDRALLLRVC